MPRYALYITAFLTPAIAVAVSIPLVLNAIPPNRWYGFRTPKTLSSPDIWYPANRRAGWYLIVSCGAALCFSLVFWTTHRDWPEDRLILWMANAFPVALIFACIASFLYLRKL